MGKSFSVWDLSAEVTVDEDFIKSQGKATPILGEKLLGKNLLTVCDGRVVWEEK
jgi:dihydroorotase-like cyclic amidohydrolase